MQCDQIRCVAAGHSAVRGCDLGAVMPVLKRLMRSEAEGVVEGIQSCIIPVELCREHRVQKSSAIRVPKTVLHVYSIGMCMCVTQRMNSP